MKKQPRRSNCPINFSLETFGDRWSLLIVRDIVYFGKHSYGEFLDADERIATNILAKRLAHLEAQGIIAKHPNEQDKRKDRYELTEKGLDLIPILLEMAQWGARYDANTGAPPQWIELVNKDRARIIALIRTTIQAGSSIFVGEDSVINQLSRAK